MIITTKTKVTLAGLASRAVIAGRKLTGGTASARVRRQGIWWDLDLNEGIDFSIYLLGAFEKSTANTLRKLVHPGNVVLDVGANIGAHTLPMAQCVGTSGRVFAFEPTDFAFAKLLRNLAINPDLEARTRASQIFLSADTRARLPEAVYASWPLSSEKEVHPKHRGQLVTTINAGTQALDDYVQQHGLAQVDLMKMDVDGQELSVLRGALGTLHKFKPLLVMEISPYMHGEQNHSFAELLELLKDVGYAFIDVDTRQPIPLIASELVHMIPDGASINAIGRAK
jgi:FkbM family methyltransferase